MGKSTKPYTEPMDLPYQAWDNCYATWNGDQYSVMEIIQHAKDLPVFEAPIQAFLMHQFFEKMSLLNVASQTLRIQMSDISYPIILSPTGTLLDGHHRLVKHLVEAVPTVKFKRMVTMPKAWKEHES